MDTVIHAFLVYAYPHRTFTSTVASHPVGADLLSKSGRLVECIEGITNEFKQFGEIIIIGNAHVRNFREALVQYFEATEAWHPIQSRDIVNMAIAVYRRIYVNRQRLMATHGFTPFIVRINENLVRLETIIRTSGSSREFEDFLMDLETSMG